VMRLQLHSGEETKAEGPLRGVLLKKGASRHVRRGMWVGRVRVRRHTADRLRRSARVGDKGWE